MEAQGEVLIDAMTANQRASSQSPRAKMEQRAEQGTERAGRQWLIYGVEEIGKRAPWCQDDRIDRLSPSGNTERECRDCVQSVKESNQDDRSDDKFVHGRTVVAFHSCCMRFVQEGAFCYIGVHSLLGLTHLGMLDECLACHSTSYRDPWRIGRHTPSSPTVMHLSH